MKPNFLCRSLYQKDIILVVLAHFNCVINAAVFSVADVLSGYNGTIFAYGQTASGKTHTMEVVCDLFSFAEFGVG